MLTNFNTKQFDFLFFRAAKRQLHTLYNYSEILTLSLLAFYQLTSTPFFFKSMSIKSFFFNLGVCISLNFSSVLKRGFFHCYAKESLFKTLHTIIWRSNGNKNEN